MNINITPAMASAVLQIAEQIKDPSSLSMQMREVDFSVFSVRAANTIKVYLMTHLGYNTQMLRQPIKNSVLCQMENGKLSKMRNCGLKTLSEIRGYMKKNGLSFADEL